MLAFLFNASDPLTIRTTSASNRVKIFKMDRNQGRMRPHTLPLVLIVKLGRVLRRPELIHTYW